MLLSAVRRPMSFHTSKRVVVIACLAAALLVSAAPASASPIISVVPSSTTVTQGGIFSVDFVISGALDLYAFQFGITFDPTLLTAFTVSEGSFLSSTGTGNFVPGFIDNNLGSIFFVANALSGPIAGISGQGTLFSVTFGALALGTSAISAVFDPLQLDDLLDSSLASIPVGAINNGSVTVVPVSVPESSSLLLLAMGVVTSAVAARWRRRRHCTTP